MTVTAVRCDPSISASQLFCEPQNVYVYPVLGESAVAQIIDRIPRCRVVTDDPIEGHKSESKATLRRLSVALVAESNR
jgi:hypothetical protein